MSDLPESVWVFREKLPTGVHTFAAMSQPRLKGCVEYVPAAALDAQAAEIERLTEYVQDIILEAGQVCGCGYDKPEDICLAHKKKMDAQAAEIERLELTVTTAVNEMRRFKAALETIQSRCDDLVSAQAVADEALKEKMDGRV